MPGACPVYVYVFLLVIASNSHLVKQTLHSFVNKIDQCLFLYKSIYKVVTRMGFFVYTKLCKLLSKYQSTHHLISSVIIVQLLHTIS